MVVEAPKYDMSRSLALQSSHPPLGFFRQSMHPVSVLKKNVASLGKSDPGGTAFKQFCSKFVF
jgi:hypothetical protein